MLLSELVAELEELLDQNGDLVVLLDSGKAVEAIDFNYPEPPYLVADSLVIK